MSETVWITLLLRNANKFYFYEHIILTHLPIPTLVLRDDPAEKFDLVSVGCRDRSKGNHYLKKNPQQSVKYTFMNYMNVFNIPINLNGTFKLCGTRSASMEEIQ